MNDGRWGYHEVYCLTHNEWFRLHPAKSGDMMHLVFNETPEGTDVDACGGPFTYSEPPEVDWDEYNALVEPDPDELRLMDEEASNFFIEPERMSVEVGE